ncbi:DoxX family protein [Brevibacillus sp. H7]|uniref:DoxX family protein n=1 Tax=Brevibacillus sp. H7 TaxID=3349138 RepID=UPI0037FDE41C
MLEKMGFSLLRIVLGVIFFAHGLAKWKMGVDEVARSFGGYGLPELLAYPVTWLELAGGIALVLGLATRYVSLAMAVLMLGAVVTVKLPAGAGLLADGRIAGYELDLALLVIAVYLSVAKKDETI